MIDFPEKPRARNKVIHHVILWFSLALMLMIVIYIGYQYLMSHFFR